MTILVNFEFFADGRDMVVVSTNTGISSICFLHDPTDFGFRVQGGTTLDELFFVSNRTYVLLRYHIPVDGTLFTVLSF